MLARRAEFPALVKLPGSITSGFGWARLRLTRAAGACRRVAEGIRIHLLPRAPTPGLVVAGPYSSGQGLE